MDVLNCQGCLLDLRKPCVMGVLNVTPDSFTDGGKYQTLDACLKQTEQMLLAGATIVDVGAMSSRPGSRIISPAEEWKRIEQILPQLIASFPEVFFSIDTLHRETAANAVKAGVHLVNDISGFRLSPDIPAALANQKVAYVLMHMQNLPENMQQNPAYENIVQEIIQFWVEKMEVLLQNQVNQIILDPGFGFGKTVAHNWELLRSLGTFSQLSRPILVGISRKSFISKTLQMSWAELLPATTAVHVYSLLRGATILRVHEVLPAVHAIKVAAELAPNPGLSF